MSDDVVHVLTPHKECGALAKLSEDAPPGWKCKKRPGHWGQHAAGQVKWPKGTKRQRPRSAQHPGRTLPIWTLIVRDSRGRLVHTEMFTGGPRYAATNAMPWLLFCYDVSLIASREEDQS